MFIGILNIVAAVIVSAVSAYFSVTGIRIIFSGAILGATLMGASLEFAKITATVWLYTWWNKSSRLLRYYLIFAILALILVSSIGIYGYLAKAYVGQRNPGQEIKNRIERIDQSIAREENAISQADGALEQLDVVIDRLFELDYLGYGIDKRNEQKPERVSLKETIDEAEDEISTLLDERFTLQNQFDDFSVDVGPIEYIAVLLYGEDDAESNFDNAVRVLIILLVLVFDPFAVLLMVCGNVAIDKSRGHKGNTRRKRKVNAKTKKNIKKNDNNKKAGSSTKKASPTIKVKEPTKKPEVTVDMSQYVDPNEIKNLKSKLKRPLQRRK